MDHPPPPPPTAHIQSYPSLNMRAAVTQCVALELKELDLVSEICLELWLDSGTIADLILHQFKKMLKGFFCVTSLDDLLLLLCVCKS